MDVSDVVGQIRVPTLVLHRKGDRAIGFDHGRQLASVIPGATSCRSTGRRTCPGLATGKPWPTLRSPSWCPVASAPRRATPEVDNDENQFVREGEVWSIAFGGRRCHLKHARGLVDLSVLLSRPGEEIFAAQLMDGPETVASVAPSADPILDERARADIRNRLRQLDRAIADAEESADDDATERGREERNALLRELRVATGLGGRRRGLVDPVERARKAVSGRIRESIEKIRGALPELAQHLDESISTGSFCAYNPPVPRYWRI